MKISNAVVDTGEFLTYGQLIDALQTAAGQAKRQNSDNVRTNVVAVYERGGEIRIYVRHV
jgi:hypothetical protein